MIFYNKKLRQLRKENKYSMEEFARKINCSRSSLSDWELARKIPKEIQVRMLAYALEVPVSEISDLKDAIISKNKISPLFKAWMNFADLDEREWFEYFETELEKVKRRNFEMRQVSVILKTLLSSFPVMFYIKDQNLRYMAANKIFLENVSVNSDIKVQEKTDYDFFSRDDARKNHAQDLNVLNSGMSVISAEDYIPGSRKKKWGLISKIPIKDNQGHIAGVIGTFIDITERKREENLRLRLEKAINSSQEVFWFGEINESLDRGFSVMFMSDAVEHVLGINKDDFSIDAWRNILHKDFKYLGKMPIAIHKFPKKLEYKIIKKDNRERWILEKIIKLNDKQIAGICIDITETKTAEKNKELLRFSIDEMKDGMIVRYLKDKNYLYINKAVSTITGYTLDTIHNYGRNFFYKSVIHKDSIKKVKEYLKGLSWPNPAYIKIKRADDQIRWLECNVTVKKLLGNDSLLVVFRDVTDDRNIHEIKDLLKKNIADVNDCIAIINIDESKLVFGNLSFKKTFGSDYIKFYQNINISAKIEKEHDFWSNGEVHPVEEFRSGNLKGELRWYKTKASEIIKSEVYGNCRIIQTTDITEKKKKEELRELIDISLSSMPDGLIIIDSETQEFVFVSKPVADIYGYPIEEIKNGGSSFFLNKILHPNYKDEHLAYHENDNFQPSATYEIIRQNGEHRLIETTGVFKIFNGRKCFIIVLRDITKRLSRTKEKLEIA
jgi:PAS domain S-box-containing protein